MYLNFALSKRAAETEETAAARQNFLSKIRSDLGIHKKGIMRMNADRMRKIAAMHPKMSVSKIAKTLEMYSLTENFQICKNAVIRAIKWQKSDQKRRKKHE